LIFYDISLAGILVLNFPTSEYIGDMYFSIKFSYYETSLAGILVLNFTT